MRFTRQVWLILAGCFWLVLPGFAQKLSWNWSNPLPHGNDVLGMAWNGSLGVQVCDSGQIYTSPDLIKWTPQNSTVTNDLEAVTFFGKRIVVTGADGLVAYSDDGTNFYASSLITSNWLASVAASSSLVVAVGDNGVVYDSTDGAHWTKESALPNIDGDWLYGVAYGNGVFVTIGDYGYIATSSNGTTWSSGSSIDGETYGDLDNVVWCNGSGSTTTFPYKGFWIVTDNYTATGDSYAFYSVNNGASWTAINFVTPPTNSLFTAAGNSTSALLAGDSEVRLGETVANKVSWPEQVGMATNDAPAGTYYASVEQSGGAYTLAGADGMLVTCTNSSGWSEPFYSPRDALWQVTVENGTYVAVGDNARIMTSDDGAVWSVEEVAPVNSISLSNTVFLCVGGTTNLLLAAGSHGSLAVSPYTLVPTLDTNLNGSLYTNYVSTLGVDWYGQPAPAGTTNDLAAIGVFHNKYYLAGASGTILSSPDGTNWTKQISGTTRDLSGLTVFTNAANLNGLLIAAGESGSILTSANGTNWTSGTSGTTNGLYRVHAFNGRLLAVGENGTLLTSTNAANWTAINSGVTNFLADAAMVSNTVYVVGNQAVVLACTNFSTNYAHWTSIGTITYNSLEGAATQNGQLIVVGFQGSILRSQIYPVPVNFLEYAQANGYNVFSVDGTVGQEFTLDSSTNLVNWVTGPLLDMIYGDGTLIFYENVPSPTPSAQYYRCTLVP